MHSNATFGRLFSLMRARGASSTSVSRAIKWVGSTSIIESLLFSLVVVKAIMIDDSTETVIAQEIMM